MPMRALILIASAELGLAACRNAGQAGNTANLDENLAAESVMSNDVTAIDAVTGEGSNMAADVVLTNESDNAVGNAATPKSKPAAAASSTPRPKADTRPAVSNSAAGATTNHTL